MQGTSNQGLISLSVKATMPQTHLAANHTSTIVYFLLIMFPRP